MDQLTEKEYEGHNFSKLDLQNADLSGIVFIDCAFTSCNLSLAKLAKTTLRDIQFKDCKMLGLHFEDCNEFGLAASFDGCILDHSSFFKRKLKKTNFRRTQLREVDFTGADLTQSIFDACDLLNAKFENTILEKTDFRTAFNYSMDPSVNKIKKTRFSLTGLPGLLEKYDIDISL